MKQAITINDYNYHLPEERVAKYPLQNRDKSKLLIYDPKKGIDEKVFTDLPGIINANSLIVYNNTRVIHARIEFQKSTGARIEIFCLNPYQPKEYTQAFMQKGESVWVCMVGNLKKWKNELLELNLISFGNSMMLTAEKTGIDDKGNQLVRFRWNTHLTFAEILNYTGKIPIPPYLNRQSEEIDAHRYQTVYSQFDGSVAAPTAGLHFTDDIMKEITKRGIKTDEVTLHVGAGTFQPVKTDNVLDHKMHGEQIIISKKLIKNLITYSNSIVAVGTTSLRTLESLYWMGVKIITGENPDHILQWDWKNLEQGFSLDESMTAILEFMDKQKVESLSSVTEIMIIPGYKFRVVKSLLTNFHQPKSTLLLLISAFVGDNWKDIYQYALNNNFRFLSYGDSSLLNK